jgi:hypothetical protein
MFETGEWQHAQLCKLSSLLQRDLMFNVSPYQGNCNINLGKVANFGFTG